MKKILLAFIVSMFSFAAMAGEEATTFRVGDMVSLQFFCSDKQAMLDIASLPTMDQAMALGGQYIQDSRCHVLSFNAQALLKEYVQGGFVNDDGKGESSVWQIWDGEDTESTDFIWVDDDDGTHDKEEKES